MFQTEVNHFFQSFASEGLTRFMVFVTSLGYMEFFMIFLIVLLLGIHFKKTFLLFQVLLWTAAITFFFKEYFNLPRPFHVDNTIQLLDRQLPDEEVFDLEKKGALNFWDALPDDVLETTRKSSDLQNGFPSGHSSIAIAFWAAVAFLFRRWWITVVTVSLMILIPISRLYLGVHFLADVLGGVALGAMVFGLFYLIILRPRQLDGYLSKSNYPIGVNWPTGLLILPAFLLMPILSTTVYALMAFMLGIGLGFLLLGQKGLPLDAGTAGQRIGRTVLGLVLFAGIRFFLGWLGTKIGMETNVWYDFFRNTLAGLVLIWISVELSIRLGWFQRTTSSV